MIINKKKLIDAATVAVPFLIGVIVGKLGLKEKPKEDTVKTEKKSEDTTTDAEAKG